ncbi:putative nicotinate phosphoribosyltransferase [Leptomonas pyrrhocoris]|uniref:nicotinate phosphoribosyltransferase n=1 Tax=Leptomonas pyrrhocoris TaxID=157538 RepID=A0A0M9FVE4_LEPPY|nr:putative nicotinate phosphoribosyltransferase [Leptomonas pyrrhocoris]KPA76676.1 putative nicotinate phosphoribosyltransferase [Leptomonas pyrrhocoris]|eukprot:XP_015655115.1 putative nicotinate phosphoribosyltransferase [Leptomonas pyrrhocoris]
MTDNKFTPIITSFLDTDAYKLHMQQAVFHQHPTVVTSYEFNCRNKDDHLGIYAEAVRKHVASMSNVRLTEEEYAYLGTLPHFKADYLEYLRNYRYKPEQVHIRSIQPVLSCERNEFGEDGSDLVVTVEGPWVETILWEIPLLAIISEVAQHSRRPHVDVPEAISTLRERLDDFFARHTQEELATFKVADFGSRRRFSKAVQEAIVRALKEDARFGPHLVGTSNYDLARRLNMPPVGTQAHEWFQAFQQLSPELRRSQIMALDYWLREYPHCLGVALTDCITMDAFLSDFDARLANAYQGLRQDSGVAAEWGQKAVAHYKTLGIDPHTKTLVFSDGLDLEKAVELYNQFKNSTNVMCGIGTQLTCYIRGVRPMNIVIKMVRCQGKPVAKVSDSPGKSMCKDQAYVEKLMEVFNVQLSPVTEMKLEEFGKAVESKNVRK